MTQSRIAQLNEFLQQSPEDPFVLFALAMEHRKIQDDEKARKYYELLVTRHPDYVGTYYHYAAFLTEQGETDRAFAMYESGIACAEKAQDAHAARELKEAFASLKLSLDAY